MSDGCRNAAPLIDELIDGTLDDARARAVRAHLRSCTDCNRRYEETTALVEAAGSLEPVDPPPSLWTRVAEHLDGDDAAEEKRSGWWWWWQAWRRSLLLGGVGLAAAALALVVVLRDHRSSDRDRDRAAAPAPAPKATATATFTDRGTSAPGPVVPVMAGVHPSSDECATLRDRAVDQAAAAGQGTNDLYLAALVEVERADAEYEHAVCELRGLVKVERGRWGSKEALAFDENLTAIDAAIERLRSAVRREPGNVVAVDALHASYRKEIEFLQEAVVRGEVVDL